MKKMNNRKHYSIIVAILLVCIFSQNSFAQSKRIKGTIKDANTEELLIGANVVIDGLFIGAATDIDGNFEIMGVPEGPFTLLVEYIGYEDKKVEFDKAPDKHIIISINPTSILSEEVIVTALARGQMAAINTQINAIQIKNVVSSAKMDEIPDATAAEAIGRLPGVTIQRSGGEANKVTVRGMGSKHNTTSIEGVTLLSTDADNRSVDISMIAPNVLSGVSVTKSLTPDMIENSLGGSVDMTLKTAKEGLHIDASAQGGYNSNISAISDYKVAVALGNRFMNDKLGIMFGSYVENRYRGKDIIDADWEVNDTYSLEIRDSALRLGRIQYEKVDDRRFRYGGSLVLDYQLPFGEIKFINFGSRMNQQTTNFSQNYYMVGTRTFQNVEKSNDDFKTQLVNKIGGNFDILNGKLSVGVSHSMAERDNPDRLRIGSYGDYFLPVSDKDSILAIPGLEYNKWINYINAPGGTDESKVDYAAPHPNYISNYGLDREYTAQIDYEVPFNIVDKITGNIKAGYMYKHRTRTYDYEQANIPVSQNGANLDVNTAIRDEFDRYTQYGATGGPIYTPESWGNDFKNDLYFNGDYNLYPYIDLEHMDEYAAFAKKYFEDRNAPLYQHISSFEKDQDGVETYNAAYAMAELKLWKNKIHLIGGARYAKQTYDYDTKVINVPFMGSLPNLSSYVRDTSSGLIEHTNILPSVQSIIKPFDWMDIRLAYNHTLSRPDFIAIIPRYSEDLNATPVAVKAGNTDLKPQLSKNIDAIVSFYGNKLGYLSFGVFNKDISDLIENDTYFILDSSSCDQHNLGYDIIANGKRANYQYSSNNAYNKTITGVEMDYQPNLHFLPYPFNGLLFNTNLTYLKSNYERYSYRVDKIKYLDPLTNRWKIKDVAVDTSYVSNTDNFIFNASLGYNYRGFTIHFTYLYKPKSIWSIDPSANNEFMNEWTPAYSRLDVKLQQKLPHGFEAFLNLNNLTQSGDVRYRAVPGYDDYYKEREEYYGMNFHCGLRYRY